MRRRSFSLTNTPGPAAAMNVYAGNNQTATVNTTFGTALAVQFLDTYGNPELPGQDGVTFILSPGTSGATGTFSASASVSNGANGIATAPPIQANGTAGAWNIVAVSGTKYGLFNLTNTTAAPAAIAAVSGTPQSTTAGTAFATPLSVKVTDSGGNPLAGFTVNFTAPSSGASAMLSAASALTNSSGIATVNATANAAGGTYNVAAAIGGYSVNFALTNVALKNLCDVNLDGAVNVLDAQLMVNESRGGLQPLNDLNGDGIVNVVDTQIVIDAALNLGCAAR